MLEADGASREQRPLIDGLLAARAHDEKSRTEQNESFHAILAPLVEISAVSARDDARDVSLPSLAADAGVVRGCRAGDEWHHIREHAPPGFRAEHRQLSVLLQRRRRGGG